MTNEVPNSIPGMNLNTNYKTNIPKVDPEAEKKKFEKTKKELEKIKDFIVKKYKSTQAVGILPPQAIPKFIEEGQIFGMCSFNQSLLRLVREGKISEEVATSYSDNPDEFVLMLKGIRKA